MAMWSFDEQPKEEAQAIVACNLAAAPGDAYQALTDAALLRGWLAPAAEVDLREGGRYALAFADGLEVAGVYINLEPGVSFLASWEAPGVEESFWEMDLQPAPGGSNVKLTHRGLPTAAAAEAYGERWAAAVERLKALLNPAP